MEKLPRDIVGCIVLAVLQRATSARQRWEAVQALERLARTNSRLRKLVAEDWPYEQCTPPHRRSETLGRNAYILRAAMDAGKLPRLVRMSVVDKLADSWCGQIQNISLECHWYRRYLSGQASLLELVYCLRSYDPMPIFQDMAASGDLDRGLAAINRSEILWQLLCFPTSEPLKFILREYRNWVPEDFDRPISLACLGVGSKMYWSAIYLVDARERLKERLAVS